MSNIHFLRVGYQGSSHFVKILILCTEIQFKYMYNAYTAYIKSATGVSIQTEGSIRRATVVSRSMPSQCYIYLLDTPPTPPPYHILFVLTFCISTFRTDLSGIDCVREHHLPTPLILSEGKTWWTLASDCQKSLRPLSIASSSRSLSQKWTWPDDCALHNVLRHISVLVREPYFNASSPHVF